MLTRRRTTGLALAAIFMASACGVAVPNRSPEATEAAPTARPTPTASSQPSTGSPVVLDAPVRVRVPMPEPELQAPLTSEVAVVGEAIWILRHGRRFDLVRFNTTSASFTKTIELEYGVGLIAADGWLWAIGPYGYAPGPSEYTVSRINPASGRVREVMDVPIGGVAIGLDSIWLGGGNALRQIDPGTGETLARWKVGADEIQVACGAVWRWSWWDDERLLRLDPATGDELQMEGTGPIYELGDACWRRVRADPLGDFTAVERVWPLPRVLTPTSAAPSLQHDGSSFWRRPDGLIQGWDPVTGEGVDTTFILDKADKSSYWKLGDDGIVVAAAGRLWLVNGFEVVGFDIPAG